MSLLPNFPSSPTNGQVATVGDYSYTYNSTTDSWEGVLGGSSGSGNFAQVFTSSGTFTVPAGITSVKVTVIGGGGGGGSGAISGYAGGGGGGGGVAIEYITGLTPGSTVAVTVGSGGSSSASGGTSSFGSYCSATGGSGGAANSGSSIGGNGGTGSGGTINLAGGKGGTGVYYGGCPSALFTGAGGGAGGSDGAGGVLYGTTGAQGGTGGLGGQGGAGIYSGGTIVSANAGTGYGHGGGGGAAVVGGAGSPGIVLVEWSASVLVVSTTTGGGIGYDQSWTDVTGSRTFGVSYTNSTEKPIQILVGASTTGAGGGVALTINGVALPGSFAYSPAVTVFSATAIVPVGATYAASAYGGASYASWHELR
jgi:hypothetical protein